MGSTPLLPVTEWNLADIGSSVRINNFEEIVTTAGFIGSLLYDPISDSWNTIADDFQAADLNDAGEVAGRVQVGRRNYHVVRYTAGVPLVIYDDTKGFNEGKSINADGDVLINTSEGYFVYPQIANTVQKCCPCCAWFPGKSVFLKVVRVG